VTSRKKAGFIAGAGIGAAAAIALRRRWSGDGGSDDTPEALSDAGTAFLDHLAEAVRIPTVAYEDASRVDFARFAELRAFLELTYPLVHRHLERELVDEHSLLFTWRGSDASAAPIMLLAHQDVVPVEPDTEGEWEYPPFSGHQSEEYLHGRGALDDKASLIGIFEAIEWLLDEGFRPTATVYIGCGHDEEAGGTGAESIARLFAERRVHLSLVLDEGGAVAVDFLPGISAPVALVGIGEKGYVDVALSARGAGGHSSAPPPSTAVGLVARAVAAIEDHPMPARLDVQHGLFDALAGVASGLRALPLRHAGRFGGLLERRLAATPTTNALIRTTTAVTMVSGGVKPNVLPQQATALVNFRVMPGDTVEDVLEHCRAVVPEGVEVARAQSSFAADPPPMADPESEQFTGVAAAIQSHFEVGAIAPWILTGATDSRHFAPLADEVLRFVPLTVSAEDFGRFHGTDERIRRADADAAVGFYRTLLRGFTGSS